MSVAAVRRVAELEGGKNEQSAMSTVALDEQADVQAQQSSQASPAKAKAKAAATKAIDPDRLWYIHGQAYDLAEFLHSHPGGAHCLLNSRGYDCTALFESYHPFTDKPHKILEGMTPVPVSEALLKERCQDRSNGNWFFLPDGSRDPFWEALRERCGKYVREHKVERTIGWGTLGMSTFLLLAQWPMWYFGYLNLYPWISHGAAVVMAVTTWIAGRLGHDGSHFAISKYPIWSQIMGNWGGMGLSNIAYWELLHTIQHHSDTNIKDADPDLYHYVVFLRDHPDYPWSLFHRLQLHRLYCYGVWSFTVAGLLIFEPLNFLLFGHGTFPAVGPYVRQRPFYWFKLLFHMIWFPVFFIGIPLYVAWDSNPNKLIVVGVRFASLFAYLSVAGLCFGLFSQINHFSEGCVPAASKNTSWAVRQVETAANFAVHSRFWDVMTGGINVQIEHHLFPGYAEDKLHGLLPIVKETCKEFGVEYKDFPTFWGILTSTHRYIDSLAAPPQATPNAVA